MWSSSICIAAPLSRCWLMKMSSKTRIAGARSARMARSAGRSSRNGSGIPDWSWAVWNSSPRCATPAWRKTPSCQARRRLLSLKVQLDEPIEEEVIENYGPLEMAKEWGKCRGRFSGKDFVLLDEATLRCPAGKLLRPRSRIPLRNGNLRICFSAKIGDCRGCSLAHQCIGVGAYGDQPRQVSGIRKRLGPPAAPKSLRGRSWENSRRDHRWKHLATCSGAIPVAGRSDARGSRGCADNESTSKSCRPCPWRHCQGQLPWC